MDSIPTVGPVPTIHIDRSHLTNVQGTIDYSDGNYWVCRPGNDKDECHDDLTATETKKDKTTDVVARPPALRMNGLRAISFARWRGTTPIWNTEALTAAPTPPRAISAVG